MSDPWQPGPNAPNPPHPSTQHHSGYPPPPGQGIAVTARYFPPAITMALFKPKILVDGYPAPPAKWGRNVVPTRPGPHRVEVHVEYWLPPQAGPAYTDVDVPAGHLVELEYKVPIWAYGFGSLGPPPQKYNNVGATIATAAIFAFFFILMPLLLVLRMVGILP
ncbi:MULTISPECIES: hypothetical protein [Mycobacterium]|uniref:Uncharacterized protein n=1 Tax=Mycobacterium gordonae TaxID=1778 RepID=A0A1A6BII9_MYCGO|nr:MULTISPECIES: hypothetical protein [Mycobacterium]MCQ4359727.1 hypothetical protein [Mycobacterium gordonae]OBS02121.1 hypothetical protein A9W98_16605 [Mycobacterium gordonae]ODR18274.1 hypothetical protein BHQ23_23530 [Mycobacterium gordonae]ORV86423.1 hypothetical protein AWC08_24250 [Mycobacterium gordonae]